MCVHYCYHSVEPFLDNPFGETREPTLQEIKEYKLYQCIDCGKWFSFIGATIKSHEKND